MSNNTTILEITYIIDCTIYIEYNIKRNTKDSVGKREKRIPEIILGITIAIEYKKTVVNESIMQQIYW